MAPALQVIDLGCIDYLAAFELQRRLTEERRAGAIPDTLLLLEHPPTITLGRNADRANVLLSDAMLAEAGIARVETDRGGDVTYHGPGQLVGYPILDLSHPPHRPDLHGYLRSLEETLIRTLATFGIRGERFYRNTGVWLLPPDGEPAKIAQIGIRVSRWITRHGFALNVSPRMEHFHTIVPCGVHEFGVTSMAAALQREIAVDEVKPAVAAAFSDVFGFGEVQHRTGAY